MVAAATAAVAISAGNRLKFKEFFHLNRVDPEYNCAPDPLSYLLCPRYIFPINNVQILNGQPVSRCLPPYAVLFSLVEVRQPPSVTIAKGAIL